MEAVLPVPRSASALVLEEVLAVVRSAPALVLDEVLAIVRSASALVLDEVLAVVRSASALVLVVATRATEWVESDPPRAGVTRPAAESPGASGTE